MKTVKTARGRIIDMAALAAKAEETRAVSNVPVNARGDIIDNRGNVKVTKEKITAAQRYSATTWMYSMAVVQLHGLDGQ